VTDIFDDPFADPAPPRPDILRNGRYYLPPVGDPTGKPVARSRVTNFVKTVSDTYTLSRWQQRELVIGLAMREDLYDLLRGTDPADRASVEDIVERAMEAAKSGRVGLSHGQGGNVTGTALHAHTDQLDRGLPVTARSAWATKLSNYEKALVEKRLRVVPDMIECRVVIERFNLAGTFDRVLAYIEESGQAPPLFIGDLKTQKSFYTWWEIAMQLALYAHADAMWDAVECRYREMPAVSWDAAIVVHMPMVHEGEDPDRVGMYLVDIAEGWKACQLVEQVRTLRTAGKRWGRPLDTLRGSLNSVERYAQRVRDAASHAELGVLFEEMTLYFRGSIPPELTAAGSARWAELGVTSLSA
jgi:hypothetical protein